MSLSLFTQTELLDALTAVMPADVVDAYRSELSSFTDKPGRMSITDGMPLVLAGVSGSHAARVVSCRPGLQKAVTNVRADPAGYLARVRAEFRSGGMPPGE